jgi:hypothetical protein
MVGAGVGVVLPCRKAVTIQLRSAAAVRSGDVTPCLGIRF